MKHKSHDLPVGRYDLAACWLPTKAGLYPPLKKLFEKDARKKRASFSESF